MQGKTKEHWRELCEQAITEQDPKKLLELAKQINQLLEEKENRLEAIRKAQTPFEASRAIADIITPETLKKP